MMNYFGGMMGGYSGASFIFWVSLLLVWVTLGLAIAALWKWVNRK